MTLTWCGSVLQQGLYLDEIIKDEVKWTTFSIIYTKQLLVYAYQSMGHSSTGRQTGQGLPAVNGRHRPSRVLPWGPQNLCKEDGTQKDWVQSLQGASSLPWEQKVESRLERMMEGLYTQEGTPLSTQTVDTAQQRADILPALAAQVQVPRLS